MPDIFVEQELPDDLKDKFPQQTTTEATLKGHLEAEGAVDDSEVDILPDAKEETTEDKEPYSPSYVPAETDKDTQLQFALKLMRGETSDAAYPPKRGR